MWTKLKGYQAFLLCMWNKCFLHCGLHKLTLTCWINTAVNYTLIDCKDFFSTAAILRFDSDSKEELNVWAFLVENPPAMREAWVWSLGWENLLEENMATHSSTLAWRIPMDRGAWRATVHGVAKSRTWLSD